MTIYCHIKNGVVDNRVIFDGDMPANWPDSANYIASDTAQIGWTYTDGEFTPPAVVVPVPTEADFANAIQGMLDAKARERGYDGIATAVSYRDDPNATYAAEGAVLFAWRSAVWTYAYAQLAAVTAGTRTQPAVANFITEIGQQCPFSWPD